MSNLLSKSGAIVLLCLLVSITGVAASDTDETVIDRDTVLSADLHVPPGATLVVKPGVTVRFNGYHRMVIAGVLVAEGTKAAPIRITGVDRPYGSTDTPSWQGLTISGEDAHALLTNVRIEGAYRNGIWECKPVFESCEIVGNHFGLYCANGAAPHIRGCEIYRNTYGVVADMSTPIMMGNIIAENTIGVSMQLSGDLVAGKNVIRENEENIKVEQALGPTNDSFSLQYYWDLMRELF